MAESGKLKVNDDGQIEIVKEDEVPSWMKELGLTSTINFMQGVAFHELTTKAHEKHTGREYLAVQTNVEAFDHHPPALRCLEIMSSLLLAIFQKCTEEFSSEEFQKYIGPMGDIFGRVLTQAKVIPEVPLDRLPQIMKQIEERGEQKIREMLASGAELPPGIAGNKKVQELMAKLKPTTVKPGSKEKLKEEFESSDALQRAIEQLKSLAKGSIN